MKKLNLSLIEKDPILRNRLKEAAKESVRDFFPGRDPPEEALEYVVAAFLLEESEEEFNKRLKLLFEKDCSTVVRSLANFVQSHPEFAAEEVVEREPERKKEGQRSRRQKIVWDASLDKTTTESSGDEKRKRTETKRKKLPATRETRSKPLAQEPVPEAKPKHFSPGSREKGMAEDESLDRWKPEPAEDPEVTPVAMGDESQEMRQTRSSLRRLPRSRLFQSALGSIRQQFKKRETKEYDSGSDRKRDDIKTEAPGFTEERQPLKKEKRDRERRAQPQPVVHEESQPVVHEASILDRIRKPDGTAFEEWELKREPTRGRKRQAEEPSSDAEKQAQPTEASEVESLKLKIARLEKEVQSVQAPPSTNYYPPSYASRQMEQDFDPWSVCVKNVHFMANEEVLAAHFHSCSPIVGIQFATDMYGQPKGFCFIQFAYEQCVERALELDQSLLLGRKISVVRKLARPPAPSPAKPSTPSEWKRSQWNAPNPNNPQSTKLIQKEEWNNEGPAEEEQDIKDFAIDTGSQELP